MAASLRVIAYIYHHKAAEAAEEAEREREAEEERKKLADAQVRKNVCVKRW